MATICDCGFKHDEDKCPICGKEVEKGVQKVQLWNSTLKANPKKRPKSSGYIKPKKSGKRNLAKTMREYVKERYPGTSGKNIPCDNCGKVIKTIKFENVSHIEGRGAAPAKAHDFENLEILCGPTDYWGEKDTSCHTLWERRDFEAFEAKGSK